MADNTKIICKNDDACEKKAPMKTVFFGKYPQNGTQPQALEWMVLDETAEEMLLLSKYSIATKGFVFDYNYDTFEQHKCLWEFSDLRGWLNGEFYHAAFSEAQKYRILTTEIRTIGKDLSPVDAGKNKVFLLSKEQVEQYLPTPELRKAVRTHNAAQDPNVLQSDRKKTDNIPWWILPYVEQGCFSADGKDERFSYIAYPQMAFDGGTQYHGRNVMHKDWSVRPAIRVRKESKDNCGGVQLFSGGAPVTKEQVREAIKAYQEKIASPEFRKELEVFTEFMEVSENDKATGKAQNTRYEYRRLGSLDKVYKLDHVLHRAYTLNAENIWEQTVNGVYQDLAHGHVGSYLIEFNDIYPTEE